MELGVSKRMLAGFFVELSLFAAAAVMCRDQPATLLLIGLGLALATALSLSLSRNIARTAREMATAARGLAEGDVDQKITLRTDDDLGKIADAFRDTIVYQREMATAADAMAHGDLTGDTTPKSDRDVLGIAFRDMRTSLRTMVDALEHQALHDQLTGLPNRLLLHDRLAHAVAGARRTGRTVALLVMDLDRFKEVNDALGHDVGDDLLCGVGRRLSQVLRDHDTFARLGGDEFAVLLPGADEGAAALAADRILESLVPAFQLDGRRVDVRASVGIVVYPDHGQDRETLLRHADVAMYAAKEAQGRVAVYAPDDDRNSPERLALVGELRHAIDLGGLSLYYQPKLDYASRAVRSVEALVRWNHPERGVLAPDVFIPLAEQSDLVERLTTWVLDEAVRQAAAWRAAGIDLQVSVNLSALNLREETLPTRVHATLERWGLPPTSLVVEITESALMADPPRALAIANEIRGLGVTLAVDDFGTGHSALAYLQHLPAKQLKIDRCFVRNMRVDDGDAAIVRSTISLAHDLGLSVVAEGVEDAETLELLAGLGCDVAQGFHLSRPIPPEALVAWLEGSHWWPKGVPAEAPLALPAAGPAPRAPGGSQAG